MSTKHLSKVECTFAKNFHVPQSLIVSRTEPDPGALLPCLRDASGMPQDSVGMQWVLTPLCCSRRVQCAVPGLGEHGDAGGSPGCAEGHVLHPGVGSAAHTHPGPPESVGAGRHTDGRAEEVGAQGRAALSFAVLHAFCSAELRCNIPVLSAPRGAALSAVGGGGPAVLGCYGAVRRSEIPEPPWCPLP